MTKLKFEEDYGLGIITLVDKPLNIIDAQFIEELEIILNGKEIDNIRALLFKVDKGNFSAGANVALLKEQDEKSSREMIKIIFKYYIQNRKTSISYYGCRKRYVCWGWI